MVSRLYVMRHGPAGHHGEWRGEDGLRPLTDKGRDAVDTVAVQLVRIGVQLDAIVTSPLVRAYETADIVAARFHADDRLAVDDRLSPGFDYQDLESMLDEYADATALMIVGHEPDLSGVVAALIGGARIDYKKGAVARIDLVVAERPAGSLVWLLTPGSLA